MKTWNIEVHQQALAEFSEWEWNLSQVAEFVRTHGHQYSANPVIAEWLSRQSGQASVGKLTAERRQRLQDLGVKLASIPVAAPPTPELAAEKAVSYQAQRLGHWDHRYARLLAWKGSGQSGERMRWKELLTLMGWLDGQFKMHRKGKLRNERRKRLASIGWFWDEDGSPLFGPSSEAPKTGKGAPAAIDEIWQLRFAEAAAFKRQRGHLHPSKTRDARLYEWCKRQRKMFQTGALSDARREKLDSLGFEWVPIGLQIGKSDTKIEAGPRAAANQGGAWAQRIAELQAFREKHGHARVTNSVNKSLAKWCGKQREAQRAGQLSSERRNQLDELGFLWNPPSFVFEGANSMTEALDGLWQQHLEELLAFHRQHGHARPTKRLNAALAKWCGRQREANRAGQLPSERRAKLDGIGFEWNPAAFVITGSTSIMQHSQSLWLQHFNELQAFHQQNGHARPSKRDHTQLAKWCERQREAFRGGKLADERRALLENIGFVWTPTPVPATVRPVQSKIDPLIANEERWQQHFAELQAFHREHGHARATLSKDRSLGKWCERQREAFREGKLTQARYVQLESLGFMFVYDPRKAMDQQTPRTSPATPGKAEAETSQVHEVVSAEIEVPESDENWNRQCSRLRNHVLQHGHSNVPRSRDAELHDWLVQQARGQSEGALPADRWARLSALSFEPSYYLPAARM